MDFAPDAVTVDVVARAQRFLDEHVYPAEPVLEAELAATPTEWGTRPVVRRLQGLASEQGLWNLFLPSVLTNLQYAPVAELTGRSPRLAPAAFNCAAPDTGNMELLTEFGTPEQKEEWLEPLLDAEIRSAFCMTEPDVASSDASQIATRIVRDGDEYVITGRKWWSTGAMNPDCALLVVMGATDPTAERHRRQSMVLVPRDTPGVRIVRPLTVFGYDDRDHGGHAEIVFDDVRVPVGNILAGEGRGLRDRAGPARSRPDPPLHAVARAWRSARWTWCVERATSRIAFGKPLADQGVVREWVAESRLQVEALRLLVLKTAWLMDTVGNRAAMTEIQAIKIAVPRAVQQILDRAIQLFGAAGLSGDQPLAEMFAAARALRLADGPDEVHLASLGRAQLTKGKGNR